MERARVSPDETIPAEGREGWFDPFRDLDVERPASETLAAARPIGPAADPLERHPEVAPSAQKLLVPSLRHHSETAPTGILDRDALEAKSAAYGGHPDPDVGLATVDLFGEPSSTRPWNASDVAIEETPAGDDTLSGELPPFLEGDESGRHWAPPLHVFAHSSDPADELPASEWVVGTADAWRERVERIAGDARQRDKRHKTRGLVVASELAAIVGDREVAIALAQEAVAASPHDPLAMRQLRQLLAAEGRWEEAAPLLEAEAKGPGPAPLRAHAAILAGDAARIARAAPDDAASLYELAQRLAPNDVRPLVARAVAALESGRPPPILRWPQGAGAEPLAEAISRRLKHGEPVDDAELATAIEELGNLSGGRATGAGGASGSTTMTMAAGAALDALSSSPTLGTAARWLRIAVDSARPRTRVAALDRLATLQASRTSSEARLALSLDLNKLAGAHHAAEYIAGLESSAHAELALASVHALDSTRPLSGPERLARLTQDAEVTALTRAIALAAGEDPPAAIVPDGRLSMAPLETHFRVARMLSTGTAIDAELGAQASPSVQQGLALARALASRSPRATLDALDPLVAWPAEAGSERALARVFALLAEGDVAGAEASIRGALRAHAAAPAAPAAPAAIDALLSFGGSATEDVNVALEAASRFESGARGATLAIRVAVSALRANDYAGGARSAGVAIERAPDDPVAAMLLEMGARRAGDLDGLLSAVRARAAGASDPVARAENLVRESILLLWTDLPRCIERLSEATRLLPADATVRALYERVAGEGAAGRAEWRATMAASLDGAARSEALLDAAREAERHGDLEAAERYSLDAERGGGAPEATLLRRRVQANGPGAARLSEELSRIGKLGRDETVRREAYEGLASLELHARGDGANAMLWHQAVLEGSPSHLPSLRHLEHALIGAGRDEAYEAVATQVAGALPPEARDAHAEVAAKLRARAAGRAHELGELADLVELATERETPSLWATRMLAALARSRGDDVATLRSADLLLARTSRPGEIAALSTRAGEAAARRGDTALAYQYLVRALEAFPTHPTALAALVGHHLQAGNPSQAAEATEVLAEASLLPAHAVDAWHTAAKLWLDEVGDIARGAAALEHAAQIDLSYADVFDRLVALARARGDDATIAGLYERRLELVEDRGARAAFAAGHASVLIALGRPDDARRAIAEVLAERPNDIATLGHAAQLAWAAAEWTECERYLQRIAQHAEDPETRTAAHRRLGALYERHLPDLRRAEEAYRNVIELAPDDDTYRTLVDVYVRLGDAEQAVETHKERVRLAATRDARKGRLLELAELLVGVAADPERAVKALEQALAAAPNDLVVLSKLASLHRKQGRPEAANVPLDAAVVEVRRRLAEDPGDTALLARLTSILELRGDADGALVVRGVRAAVEGTPQPAEMRGGRDAAGDATLDDLLCPPELSPVLRALLRQGGDVVEKSVPVDLRALKASKLGTNRAPIREHVDSVAKWFGLAAPDVVVSRTMPLLCLPVGSRPFQIVLGESVVETYDEAARTFALARAMRLCAASCSSLIRVPPADLQVYLDALLHYLHPEHPPPAVEPDHPDRLDEITKQLQRYIRKKDEADLRAGAAAVSAEGLEDAHVIAGAAATWADRVALLAIGDVAAALRGVAWTLGNEGIPSVEDDQRRAWLRDNPAARDLVRFALSDEYLQARRRAGVALG